MQLSVDAVCSNSTDEYRLNPGPGWVPDAFEICVGREFRLRGLAWGLSLSAIFWASFIFAGHELWSLWR